MNFIIIYFYKNIKDGEQVAAPCKLNGVVVTRSHYSKGRWNLTVCAFAIEGKSYNFGQLFTTFTISKFNGGKMETYKHSRNCVGANRKHVRLTTKYRYKMMRSLAIKTFCRVAVEEACRRHGIVVEIIKVMDEHVHMIVYVPRTMSDAFALQIIKGLSSWILFRVCENLRKRYPKDIFGTKDISATELKAAISRELIFICQELFFA
ncbi:transposase [Candidatus Pacearchaeota archaeon]|nr:transposase [Candidatus Pacearchaeota archaeon]